MYAESCGPADFDCWPFALSTYVLDRAVHVLRSRPYEQINGASIASQKRTPLKSSLAHFSHDRATSMGWKSISGERQRESKR